MAYQQKNQQKKCLARDHILARDGIVIHECRHWPKKKKDYCYEHNYCHFCDGVLEYEREVCCEHENMCWSCSAEGVALLNDRYCENCVCIVPDCLSQRQSKLYCAKHTCMSCNTKCVVDSLCVCSDCKCLVCDCFQKTGFKYCEAHLCKRCDGPKANFGSS